MLRCTWAVEWIKQQTCPVLNWDNRQCVKIHTLSATLQNSRCLSSPQGRFSEWDQTSISNRTPRKHRVSFETHVEQRTDASEPGCMLPCKSCPQTGLSQEEILCCGEENQGHDNSSFKSATPRRASNWLSAGTAWLWFVIALQAGRCSVQTLGMAEVPSCQVRCCNSAVSQTKTRSQRKTANQVLCMRMLLPAWLAVSHSCIMAMFVCAHSRLRDGTPRLTPVCAAKCRHKCSPLLTAHVQIFHPRGPTRIFM